MGMLHILYICSYKDNLFTPKPKNKSLFEGGVNMRIQSSGRSMQMMSSYQDVDNDISMDFANEISEEMADEVAKTSILMNNKEM